ncbi:MAG: pyridoxamine 5'-phosphate oxidase family protein [Pseudomonadota bacterium]
MPEAAKPGALYAKAADLLATTRRGSLASHLARDDQPDLQPGFPYVSLVLLAPDTDGRPFLLLSDLSEHAQNLQAKPDLALLLEQTADKPEPLAEPRLTLLGDAQVVSDKEEALAMKKRFVEAQPSAEVWAGFGDFRPYRITWRAAHFVAGFGRIAWLSPDRLAQELGQRLER